MYKERIVNNVEDMNDFAQQLSTHVFPGFVLCLEGDLGAGKTTLTKYLGKAIGIDDMINSPTFTIMKIYEGKLPLYHMDVYRLNGIGADYDLEDYIYRDGLCVIEWYKHIIDSLPEDRLVIEIEIQGPTKRLLKMEGHGTYEAIVEALSN
ncbi:tRNA (adenosine(37)-N6)-threonylcarbamoyltransferase complex ATPase subunit type 1 TsaE [Candidatus Xianfuyuplasma coldseepsis]|uniref:tRNA threonylcarbamoyladenosine biosynthesis protein TsaE n=1 Tax=Candidatus Xianfuyuplasma coldseepsis TaxID=2782163 RepID=A0A7L7KQ29_9MOLU|nr:tRNA (adenosine(37)-N6)-threonylcarbamoyltransferase complex ATPase subunit type 1 TsaE [Xianfuyuplasma coldseepsis]QMS84900.1 tRNA (adenosine(37)-N6)-threonylcarbamoyltransferase complex ATPase subunit type 1 TsaE [Xianfuyuplasma coldseepsis]